MKQYKNTVQTVQNTVSTIHIFTKHPHIIKPTRTQNHTLQNKLKQPQYKIQTKENSHNTIKYTQYKVTLMYMALLSPKSKHRDRKGEYTTVITMPVGKGQFWRHITSNTKTQLIKSVFHSLPCDRQKALIAIYL